MNFIRFSMLVVAGFALSSCGRFEETTEEVGWKGAARFDHFLAVARFTEAMGIEANSYAGLPQIPPPQNSTLIVPASVLKNAGLLERIDDWVYDEGGHLICYLDLGHNEDELSIFGWDTTENEPFLDYWAVETKSLDVSERSQTKSFSFTNTEELPNTYETAFTPSTSIRWSDTENDEGDYYTCIFDEYGDGVISVWSTLSLFTNSEIGKVDHASLLWDYLAITETDEVIYVYGTGTSFFELLWKDAPYAILVALGLIILSVWHVSRRFGPKLQTLDLDAAHLSSHFKASGYFFMKHDLAVEIVDEMKSKLISLLRLRCNLPQSATESNVLSAAVENQFVTFEEVEFLSRSFPVKKHERLSYLNTLKKIRKND